jgi:hypothetical protein
MPVIVYYAKIFSNLVKMLIYNSEMMFNFTGKVVSL